LAAGRAPGPYLRAMEGFASPTGLLPEQVWDEQDRPDLYMYLGRPTGSARPLMWAHAEYIKLLRSAADGKVFDLVPEVADRYLPGKRACKPMEIWKHNRQVSTVGEGFILRIQAGAPFLLHWTRDNWGTAEDSRSTATPLGIEYLDINTPTDRSGPIRFTFFWPDAGRWEGREFEVAVLGS
jgi:glucoamylase